MQPKISNNFKTIFANSITYCTVCGLWVAGSGRPEFSLQLGAVILSLLADLVLYLYG
jgi:hypothetical protein